MLKTILAAVLILGASSAFASEFDGNLENRYPQASQILVTKPVAMPMQAPSSKLDIAGQTFGGGY